MERVGLVASEEQASAIVPAREEKEELAAWEAALRSMFTMGKVGPWVAMAESVAWEGKEARQPQLSRRCALHTEEMEETVATVETADRQRST